MASPTSSAEWPCFNWAFSVFRARRRRRSWASPALALRCQAATPYVAGPARKSTTSTTPSTPTCPGEEPRGFQFDVSDVLVQHLDVLLVVEIDTPPAPDSPAFTFRERAGAGWSCVWRSGLKYVASTPVGCRCQARAGWRQT